MIAVDTNVLVYAHVPAEPRHEQAVDVLRRLHGSGKPWGIAAPCVAEFLRVMTHPRVYRLEPARVIGAIEHMREQLGAHVLLPDGGFVTDLGRLCVDTGLRGNAVFAAQIAVICAANHVDQIVTADRRFVACDGLEVVWLDDSDQLR